MSVVSRVSNSVSYLAQLVAVAGPIGLVALDDAAASSPPAIRIIDSSPYSQVPACVTPERLMAYLVTRNPNLDPRYRDIAKLYKQHGEAWRVRWDYAFYQMVVETNALMFKRGDGKSGDVNPKQYNFAGLGTTGGGVPGDAYQDASTGVLAQIQHLVVYSGERVERPIGSRTKIAQDDILSASAAVSRRRPVTWQDLSGRWAADRRYGNTIESVAERYRQMFCNGREPAPMIQANSEPELPPIVAPAPRPAIRPSRPSVAEAAGFETRGLDDAPVQDAPRREPVHSQVRDSQVRLADAGSARISNLGVHVPRARENSMTPPRPLLMSETGPSSGPGSCKVQTASFGGRKALLIRAVINGQQNLTALQVLDGFEASMSESYARAYAPGGQVVGEFSSPDAALEHAYRMCATPSGHASRNR